MNDKDHTMNEESTTREDEDQKGNERANQYLGYNVSLMPSSLLSP
jgi:hypothetical protein